jgi:glycerol-3-phosphate dehydrogenase
VIVPAGEGRTIFALPWLGRTLIGTTDQDYRGDLDHVSPASAEVQYLLDAANGFFGCGLTPSQLTGGFAGLRPLIATGDPNDTRSSAHVSRRAELDETAGGLITITGGKLTIWRRMAKLVVDRIVARDGRRAPCQTHRITLGEPVAAQELERVEGVAENAYAHLAARYGSLATQVLQLAAERPELGRPIVDHQPDLFAEIVFAARTEQAGSVDDVLSRRTRLAQIAAPDLTRDAVGRVAELLAGELGWSAQHAEAELERFERQSTVDGLCPA